MTEKSKGGRPPVDPQGSTSIQFQAPAWAAERAARLAAEHGVPKATVHRDTYLAGVGEDREESRDPQLVRPAAEIIARWIGMPQDAQERRTRFLEWHRVSDNPYKGTNLLLRATGELTVAGVEVPRLTGPLMEQLITRGSGWRIRTLLALSVVAVLQEMGITVQSGGELPEMAALAAAEDAPRGVPGRPRYEVSVPEQTYQAQTPTPHKTYATYTLGGGCRGRVVYTPEPDGDRPWVWVVDQVVRIADDKVSRQKAAAKRQFSSAEEATADLFAWADANL